MISIKNKEDAMPYIGRMVTINPGTMYAKCTKGALKIIGVDTDCIYFLCKGFTSDAHKGLQLTLIAGSHSTKDDSLYIRIEQCTLQDDVVKKKKKVSANLFSMDDI